VTNLQPEVELMHLLRMRRHYRHKSRGKRCRAPKMTASLYQTDALNSNIMTPDFKHEVAMVETAHAQRRIAQIGEKLHRTAKIFATYRKSLSLNEFPVKNLRPEVELMHLLWSWFKHTRHWTDSEFA